MNNNKMKLWLIIPVCAIVLLLGGTYAWYVWQTSQDEETIIATDTGYAQVFFDGGSDVNGKLKPVSDKSKGMSKEIIVIADKAFIEPISFNLYLDINSIDENLKHESFKFELYKDGNLVKAGNFSDTYLTGALSNCEKNTGASHITLTNDVVTTTESVYTLYTWIDGNMSNPIGMEGKDFDFTLHADGQHALLAPDPLIHKGIIPEGGVYTRAGVEYTAGQAFPELVEGGDAYVFGDYNYIYINTGVAESSIAGWLVTVIDKTKESYGEILKGINEQDVVFLAGTFANCTSLVNAPEIPDSVTDMSSAFQGCTSLVNVPKIGNSVTRMDYTFSGCTSLVNAPKLPNSLTDLTRTFEYCTNLKNAPEIPNSVTSMTGTFFNCTGLETAPVISNSVTSMNCTFENCTSLVNVPKLPNSLTRMVATFFGCTSLVEAPELPDSVTDIRGIFYGCTNLAEAPIIPESVTHMVGAFGAFDGFTNYNLNTIRIMSSSFEGWGNGSFNSIGGNYRIFSFVGSDHPITVEVPEGSITYDSFMTAKANGEIPDNITITTFVKE